jgi:hypothetical protein
MPQQFPQGKHSPSSCQTASPTPFKTSVEVLIRFLSQEKRVTKALGVGLPGHAHRWTVRM